MKSNFSELQLRQLDASLNRWRCADLPPRPPSGWVKAIREADDTISLGTLRRAAEALDCELRYALIPKQSLADTLESRAMSLARQQMAAVSHSMALEAQSTSRETVELQTRALAEELLKGSRRALWRESREIREPELPAQ